MQQGPTRTEISPRHHTATNELEFEHISMICTSFGMWSIGLAKPHPHPQGFTYDNTSCSTSFARGLLALPSLTHTLKDLPLPPPPKMGSKEWRVAQYPFCMWSFGPIGNGLIHTLKDLPVSYKVWVSNLTSCLQDMVITNIIAQGQSHIKSPEVQCIQNTSFTSK